MILHSFNFIKIFNFAGMLRKDISKKFFSTFITALYLFVALFSQDFHSHENQFKFKNSDSEKVEKSVSTSNLESDSSNCLSCHFLYTGNTLIPQEFNLEFYIFESILPQIFEYQSQILYSQTHTLFLRGPPNVI